MSSEQDREIIDQRDISPLFKTGDIVQFDDSVWSPWKGVSMIVLKVSLSKVESRLGTEYIHTYRLLQGDKQIEVYEFGLRNPE